MRQGVVQRRKDPRAARREPSLAHKPVNHAGTWPTRAGRACSCGGGCPRCRATTATGRPADAAPRRSVPSDLRWRAERILGIDLGDVSLVGDPGPMGMVVAPAGGAATRGNEIRFAGGLPDWGRRDARFLLGHELAHVAQQRDVRTTRGAAVALDAGADGFARAFSGAADLRTRQPAEGGPPQGVQFGVAETIGGAIRTVEGVVDPLLDPLESLAHQGFARLSMALLDVPALVVNFVTNLPWRLLRMSEMALEGEVGLTTWQMETVDLILHWQGLSALWAHFLQGVIDGANFAAEFLVAALEVFGLAEFLQFLWHRANPWMRPLDGAQIAASQEVHPSGLIPYWMVRVDYGSLVARLAAQFSPGSSTDLWTQITGGPGSQFRAVTTMHVIHTGPSMDEQLAVHELTHVGQYELIGARYMPQAIHAQIAGRGYDYNDNPYGSLAAAAAADATFTEFNREQQAQICEDFYCARRGLGVRFHGALVDLEYFINDYWGRARIPLVRQVVPQ